MAEIREYSYVHMDDKILNPVNNPRSVVRSSVQLRSSDRLRIYRDMAYPETLVAESPGGPSIEYAWALVVSARRAPSKVVPIATNDDPQQRSSNPQNQQGNRR
jgi:hypothetical protein